MVTKKSVTLLIDTASILVMAIFDSNKKCLFCYKGDSSFADGINLLLEETLTNNSLSYGDIKTLVVDTGPGSFTGLRTGLAYAQGLCFPSKIPIYTFNSYEPLLPLKEEAGNCRVIIPARRNHYYTISNEQALQDKSQIKIWTTDQILDEAENDTTLIVPEAYLDKSPFISVYKKLMGFPEAYNEESVLHMAMSQDSIESKDLKPDYIQLPAADAKKDGRYTLDNSGKP
ncbi:MAG: tRNA (adenosine(37)-N6)-threonylcarbamoyltransferase complex dimerization subunit type 1 TsaB [Fibrobacteria bacterium]|nr:tRNA (adenosine(37)-N6)-threonylcarbamoyltransferase complex dimerization subunit type 1 TsaB [Fibrobacteria bacterium]